MKSPLPLPLPLNTEDLCVAIENAIPGERMVFRNKDFRNLDLSDLQVSPSKAHALRSARFVGCCFSCVDLSCVDLSLARFERCHFENVDADHTRFCGAVFDRCSNLAEGLTSLRMADFYGARFLNCDSHPVFGGTNGDSAAFSENVEIVTHRTKGRGPKPPLSFSERVQVQIKDSVDDRLVWIVDGMYYGNDLDPEEEADEFEVLSLEAVREDENGEPGPAVKIRNLGAASGVLDEMWDEIMLVAWCAYEEERGLLVDTEFLF